MKRGIIVGGISFAALIVWAIIYSFSRPAGLAFSQAFAVPDNFKAATSLGDNSIVLANGRSLVEYNYTSGKTTLLSPDNPLSGLSGIDSLSVSTGQQYILFHLQNAGGGGFLYAQLAQQGLDPNQGYWWVYSVSKQTFDPLPQGIVLAKFNNNTIAAIVSANGSETLNTFSPESLTSTGSIPITGASNFFISNNGYLLQTPDNSVLSTSNGVVSQTIASSAIIVGVDPASNSAVITTGSSKNLELETLNLTTNAKKMIAQSVLGQAVVANGVVLYNTGSANSNQTQNLYSYNLQTHKTSQIKLPSNLPQADYEPLVSLGPNAAIVNSSAGGNYVIGNQLANLKFPNPNYSSTVNFADGSTTTLQFSNQTTQLTANLNDTNTAGGAASVYQQIQHDGYNPTLMDISFSINGGTGDE